MNVSRCRVRIRPRTISTNKSKAPFVKNDLRAPLTVVKTLQASFKWRKVTVQLVTKCARNSANKTSTAPLFL